MTGKQALALLKAAGSQWNDHNAPRLGASLAYYTLLSLAPLLVLLLAVCGLAFSKTAAEEQLIGLVRDMAGRAEAQTLKTFVDSAHRLGSGITATILALVTLLFGASGVFVELRDSMNAIWDVPPPKTSSLRSMVAQRLVAFAMILVLGVLLMASFLFTAGLTVVQKAFANVMPLPAAIFSEIGNHALSLLTNAFLFGLVFRFVPSIRLRWRDVAMGAVVTAVLFEIGKALLALYIGTAGVGSSYGAAGSVIALVVWVYYSAQIFFFGASFTRVYAERYGSQSANATQRA